MNDEIYALGEKLERITKEQAIMQKGSTVFLTDPKNCHKLLSELGIQFEGELNFEDDICKVEIQQGCVFGMFAIPKLSDVLGERYRIFLIVNKEYIVIADGDNFSHRLIQRIQLRKTHQGDTREKFLYNFMAEFIRKDIEMLNRYEHMIIQLEDDIMNESAEDFQKRLLPIRKELLELRVYYDELADAAQELEDNENSVFEEEQLKFFGTISSRAERLKGKTSHLLEFAQQVKDVYQAQIDTKQNRNMHYLTLISTIFLPLTLITGWFGMNFENMPGLKHGFPVVVAICIAVVVFGIIKIKKHLL